VADLARAHDLNAFIVGSGAVEIFEESLPAPRKIGTITI
jgi:hypothetical protein